MNREEWLCKRKLGIGGSDASAIMGLNKYKGALEVYEDKISDEIKEEDNEYMKLGRYMEPCLHRMYKENVDDTVREGEFHIHPKYDFLRGTTDALTDTHIVEYKFISRPIYEEWSQEVQDEYGYGDIPDSYYTQIQHYMMVTGYNRAHLYAYIAGHNPWRLYPFKRDVRFVMKLRARLIKFWKNHVEARVEPEPTNARETRLVYPKPDTTDYKEANDHDKELITELSQVKEELKALKKREINLKDLILPQIAGYSGLKDEHDYKLVSFKATKTSRTLRLH